MAATLKGLLNQSLKLQGINDVRVVELSKDFQVARVHHLKDGKIIAVGALPAVTLLKQEEPKCRN